MAVLLASGSPQRRAILAQLHIPFRTWVPDLRELTDGDPATLALRNSRLKAEAARHEAGPSELVLACDTVVVLGDTVYGKPSCEEDACDMLRRLRGRTHTVISGVTLCLDGNPHGFSAHTAVRFRDFTPAELDDYVATGEWDGRAGGYAIQGAGAVLVGAIDGDYYNVVGFPVAAFLDLVAELGVRPRLLEPSRADLDA